MRSTREGMSWTDAKKVIAKRQVQLNGNLCTDEARRLNPGDIVRIGSHAAARPLDEREIIIRHLDEHILVVEKPTGVTSTRHAEEKDWSDRRRQIQPTLDELLPVALAMKSGKIRLDLAPTMLSDALREASKAKVHHWPTVIAVHRLDRETSGLMVFARTRPAAGALTAMFAKHEVDRRYRAVVLGDCADMVIDTFLSKDISTGKRASVAKNIVGAQHAVTHVKRISTIGNYSLIECRLETGRTHQIRIHLSERGHAICGDKIYRCDLADASNAPRHALHSYSIQFLHPHTDNPMRFEMDWPLDLANWMKPLGFVRK